jgi:hypothetical protein
MITGDISIDYEMANDDEFLDYYGEEGIVDLINREGLK